MKLSVHLVTWNGSKYVLGLFDSLRKQGFKDWKLYILDNASEDGMLEKMKKELKDFPVDYQVIESKENSGFAGGHNRLFKESQSEYFLLLNQDMYLAKNCLENLVNYMDKNTDISALTPRLMHWNFSEFSLSSPEKSFSDSIDALGLKVFRSRRVIEQYTQKSWQKIKSKFNKNQLEVFGVSGAFPMFRRSDLDQVAYRDGSIFDQSYHAYKEDVDLAFRLVSAGKKSVVLLNTVAYHDRAGAGPEKMGDIVAAKNKKEQSDWVKYHSYKNQLMTVYKNEYLENFILDFPWILWYELKKFIWFLLFNRSVLKGLKEVKKNKRDLKQKRLEIRDRRKATWKEIRKWWK